MNKFIVSVFIGAISCLSFFMNVSFANADQWTEQVRTQIRLSDTLWRGAGYSKSYDDYFGGLREGRSNTVSLNLRRGYTYKIIGLCDNDCSDIDLSIYDENNNLIDRDILVDDLPILNVSPRRTGPFSLNISMADCRIEPCRYAVTVYFKPN